MVLAATNRPSELDEAILRRFSQAFEIGIPTRKERAEILKVILKGERVEENIDFDYLASLCEGCTGSDLFDLCKKAAYIPIRELLDDEKSGKPLNVSNFLYHPFFNVSWQLSHDSLFSLRITNKKKRIMIGLGLF